jgi:hydrogenase maturation protease
MKNSTLILGVGNYLQQDDGLSVHTIERLMEDKRIPEDVRIVDGGTCGLDLMQYLEGVDHLILLDAVHAGEAPGTIVRLSGDQVPAYLALKISPHDIGLPDLMATAKLRDIYPEHVTVLGIEPETIDFGIELSATVAGQIDSYIEMIIAELDTVTV